MFKLEVHHKAEAQAASRSRLYGLLVEGFQFPTPEVYERVQTGRFGEEVAAQLQDLPYESQLVRTEGNWGKGMPVSLPDFQSEYIRLFDMGGPEGPPTVLYEGQYSGSVTKAMEEVLAFYHYFGLRRSPESRERPDHIAVELEFMHYLTFREAQNASQGEAKLSYLAAQRDFLKLHLLDFVSAVADGHSQAEAPFYGDLVSFGKSFCHQEMAYLIPMHRDG